MEEGAVTGPAAIGELEIGASFAAAELRWWDFCVGREADLPTEWPNGLDEIPKARAHVCGGGKIG
jgi:hypothetical protein